MFGKNDYCSKLLPFLDTYQNSFIAGHGHSCDIIFAQGWQYISQYVLGKCSSPKAHACLDRTIESGFLRGSKPKFLLIAHYQGQCPAQV